jgi:uncharacterized repeat protein (TIGR01451 family)
VIGSAPLSFFSANVSSGNFSTSLLASGNHSITAEYVPAGFFAASTSPPLAQVVLPPSAVADLAMTKTDGLTTVTAGQPVVYTIVVQNLGPDLVGGATVSDVLPALLQGATWTCAASPGSSCTPAGSGSINDTVNLLVSGTASYVVTATVDPAASGSLVNTASVAVPLGVLDPNLANNSATDVDAITPAGPSRVFVSVLGLDTNDCSNVATPCRTLDAAIGQVAVEGQVIVIGTGSYAGATITKSVKIDVAPGAVAYSGQPFTVNAGPASTVVIRGLTLKALTPGTGTGLLIQSAGAVLVERSVIDGWGTGILTQSVAEVFVNDSTIRNNVTGVGATTGDVSLDNVRLTNNGTAIDAQTALSLRGATASGNATGISAGTGSSVTVEKTQIANNGTGVSVPAGSGATARLSRCVVSGNVLGLENVGGTIEVSGNNVVRGNTTNTSGAITTTGLQ